MGIGVEYKCTNCRYTVGIGVGCGLIDKRTWLPALNKSLKEIVAVDTSEPIADVNNIILYTDLTLNRKPFFRFTPPDIKEGGDELPTKYNFCPKCGKYKMTCKGSGWLID